MNQTEQETRIVGAEIRNEITAKATYDLQQELAEQAERIEKLEAALRDVARCLIDGKVDVDTDAAIPGTMFHRHRILGAESVQAIVEVYHRLKE